MVATSVLFEKSSYMNCLFEVVNLHDAKVIDRTATCKAAAVSLTGLSVDNLISIVFLSCSTVHFTTLIGKRTRL
jgi:hypothetical protein